MTYHNADTFAHHNEAPFVFAAFTNCNPDSPDFARRAADVWRALKAAGTINSKVYNKPFTRRTLRQKPCVYPFPMAQVEFADGMSFLFAFYSPAGKPLDWSHAERVAIGHWQARKLSAWRRDRANASATFRPARAAGEVVVIDPATLAPSLRECWPEGWGPFTLVEKHDGRISLDDQRAAEAAFLRRNPAPAIVRMTETHGTRAELAI